MSSSVVPGNLLQAVASRRGRVALLVGAGCSVENPTGLKLSGEYAREVGRQLVDDGVLQRDELPDAEDLSELAEVVYARTGSKKQVVARLPREKFRNASSKLGISRCRGSHEGGRDHQRDHVELRSGFDKGPFGTRR